MKAFDPKATRTLGISIALSIPMCWYCAYIAWDRWIIQNTDPNQYWRGYVVAFFLCIVHPVFLFVLSRIGGIWDRIFMKYEIDNAGISTGGFLIGQNEYLWDEIREYAVNAKNKDSILLMFSKKETDRTKTGNQFGAINKNQIVVQLYNDDMWYNISSYIPDDIRTNIEQSFTCGEIKIFAR